MSWYGIAGAEYGTGITSGAGVWNNRTGGSIVATPALGGNYSFQVDPVNGNPVTDTYGWSSAVLNDPNLVLVSFIWRLQSSGYDGAVTIAEMGKQTFGGGATRVLVLTTDERLRIIDNAASTIEETAASFVAVDTDYPMLWYLDMRSRTATRDMLWVWKSGAWVSALDTSDNGNAPNFNQVSMGTHLGKGLPTSGGPMNYKNFGLQVLNELPRITPLGSIDVKYVSPNANGTDGDFDAGTGTNPDYQDVDEIPHDSDTSYDAGDAADDEQSYALADATGGDDVLAAVPVAMTKRTAGGAIVAQLYFYDGATKEFYEVDFPPTTAYDGLGDLHENVPFNTFAGDDMSESIFNGLEVGIKLVSVASGECRLTQIGAEYAVEGPNALPSDFPPVVERPGSDAADQFIGPF